VVAEAHRDYDVILADLYDGRGAVGVAPDFWRNCARALRPGGCLAVNWAAFVDNEAARAEAERITEAFGQSFFVETRRVDENVVQLAPLNGIVAPNTLAARWRRFALEHRLPREDRDVLKRCAVRRAFPG
jgi:spermidine synthase